MKVVKTLEAIDVVSTVTGKRQQWRVAILQRDDGYFTFAEEYLYTNVWEAKIIARGWARLPSEGIFASVETAPIFGLSGLISHSICSWRVTGGGSPLSQRKLVVGERIGPALGRIETGQAKRRDGLEAQKLRSLQPSVPGTEQGIVDSALELQHKSIRDHGSNAEIAGNFGNSLLNSLFSGISRTKISQIA